VEHYSVITNSAKTPTGLFINTLRRLRSIDFPILISTPNDDENIANINEVISINLIIFYYYYFHQTLFAFI